MPETLMDTLVGTPRFIAVIIASITIAVVIVVLPLYIYIVTLFFKKSRCAKFSAYWNMGNIGIIDCLFLMACAQASVVSLLEQVLIPVIFEVSSAIHCVYEWVLHFLVLILAINRVVSMLNLKIRFANVIFKILTAIVWCSIFVILFVFHQYGMFLMYLYNDSSFALQHFSNETEALSNVVYSCYYYGDVTAVSLASLCYVVVIVAIILQVCPAIRTGTTVYAFRNFNSVKASKSKAHEIRIFAQGLMTFLPGAAYWALAFVARFNFTQAPLTINVVFSILPRLVPVLNFCGYLALNTQVYVRDSLKELVMKVVNCKGRNVRPISLGSGKAVSASRINSAS